jgi:hypothetical protein
VVKTGPATDNTAHAHFLLDTYGHKHTFTMGNRSTSTLVALARRNVTSIRTLPVLTHLQNIQDDQKASERLMITGQKHAKYFKVSLTVIT